MYRPILAAVVVMLVAACSSVGYLGFAEERASGNVNLLSAGNGHGSGTFIGDGYVLTAAHVAEKSDRFTVKDIDGKEVEASVLWSARAGASQGLDAAILKLDTKRKGLASIDCRPPQLGETFFYFGNPGPLRFFLSRGYTAATEAVGPDSEPVKYRIPVATLANGGDSGSAAFNQQGDIRGIIVGAIITQIGMYPATSGNGLMVPTSFFCDEMPDLPGLTKVRA